MRGISSLRQWLANRREKRALSRRPIPEKMWRHTLSQFPFLGCLPPHDEMRLRQLTSLFLDSKQFSGAHGLQVSDEMAVAVAAQASLPILNLGLARYERFIDIVLHHGELRARRSQVDALGLVHEFDDVFSGEIMPDGEQLTLSWEDVTLAGARGAWAYSVVIHEVAHVLDLENGQLDGIPAMSGRSRSQQWGKIISAEYRGFCDDVSCNQDTVLDPYAEQSIEEFFAVACETFFITPRQLRDRHFPLYEQLAMFFRQDPCTRL